jgi:hypothetical protein
MKSSTKRPRRKRQQNLIELLERRQMLAVNVLTWHNDLARTGLNPNEQVLTPANVNSSSFGKLFSYPVTGQVYTQPLYVSNLNIPGQGTRNVVFVATMNNDVYAFDANSTSGPDGGVLWHVNLGPAAAVPSPFIGFRYGPDRDTTPLVGVTSTPVIDLASNTIYLDAFTNDIPGQDAYSHHIHALDLRTGGAKATPKLVTASVRGNGVAGNGTTVTFAANRQIQRAALTMYNGVLYAAYGAYADTDPYHGWILGFDPATLDTVSIMNTTPNLDPNSPDAAEGEGGIWQSGAGMAADGSFLYVETGNGDFDSSVGAWSDSVLKIATDSSTPGNPNINGWGLHVADYFTPYNEQQLADADADLGSAGAIVLPDQPGAHPHELAAIGKQGTIYLIDRDNLGQYNAMSDNVIQKVSLGRGFWGSPAYFNSSLYYHAVNDVLKRYSLSSGLLSAAPAAQSMVKYPTWPGATPSISANGTANGIAWEVQFETGHQVLHAYDATTLAELFNSNQNAARDQMGAGVKFITPTIADGRVYVGSSGALSVYGLIQPVTTAPTPPSALTATATTTAGVQLTWVDNSDNESTFEVERSTDDVTFTPIATVGVDVRSYNDTAINSNTHYYYRVRAANVVGNSPYTSSAQVTTLPPTGATYIYRFDAGSGNTAADSASGNNGTLAGSPLPQWVTPGRAGAAALSFSGDGVFNSANSQSAVSLQNGLSPALGSSSTMTFWIQTTQTGSNSHWLAPAVTGVEQAGGANDINWGTLDAIGRIGLYVGDSGGVYSAERVNDGQWHHIALTRDAGTGRVQIYVDGVLNATHVLETGAKTTPFSLIGALTVRAGDGVTQTGATYFNGKLDEIRIYNAVLGGNEIAAQAVAPGSPTLISATAMAGPVVHLTFSSPDALAESIQVLRKTGVNGTFAPIATLAGGATSYDDTSVQAGVTYYYALKSSNIAGASAASNALGVTPPIPRVVGMYVFYNRSNFDGQNGSSNVTDRTAIATDKQPLLPGHTATFQNYTSYSRGLNGIIIDVADMEVLPRIDDFEFRVGNSSDPSTWTQAPTPAFINTYPGRGPNGETQITVIWDDNAIQNEWLKVTLLAEPHLGLASNVTFYFGNAIGETGDSAADAQVTSADASRVSANQAASANVTNLYDINRDGAVNSTDVNVVDANQTGGGTPLQLISLGTAPTVATAAHATPSPVTGTTTTLSTLGADAGGEANLTYTWTLVGAAPAPVTFSLNGTNAAKNTIATFTDAGSYNFLVTIANASGVSVTSAVAVQVNQTPSSILVSGSASIPVNTAAAFAAKQLDQFGNAMAAQPQFAWSVTSGGGTITSAGVYTSGRAAGGVTISASAGGSFGSAGISVVDDALEWYKANESSGAALSDSSGNSQAATLTGAYSFGLGVSGNGLILNGGNATLPAGVVSSFNDFTIATWVKVTTLQNWARIFDFGSGVGAYMFLSPMAGDSGKLRFAITTGSNGNEQRVDGPAMQANAWTHVAITLSGDTATMYVNGVAVGSNDAMTLHPTNLGATTQNYLGKSQWADPALLGSIDDFRIYSRALSADQVARLAQVVSVVTPAAATPSPVTGTSTALSVLGVDQDGTESGLTYTWATTGTPPAAVNFSVNGTNAAKNTTATFSAAGSYNFVVTIRSASGVSVASNVTVIVSAVASGVRVVPGSATVETGMTVPFIVTSVDQFGNALAGSSPISATWSIQSGGGTISPSGVYTAPAAAGSATITGAAAGYPASNATITIVNTKRALYQANSTTGNTLTDSSGQNRNGTTSGAHTWSAGVAGNAINLTGGFVNLPDGIVSGVNDFTIATWVKVSNLANWARIFDFGNNTDSWMFLTPSAGGTNALRFSIKTAGNAAQELDGPAINANTWTHVAVTLLGDVATMYVNGVAVATNPAVTYRPAGLGNTTENFIGDSQYPADPLLQGSIDDFRIYTRSLGANEIAQLVRPTIVNAAVASANPVTTTSTSLSALANDVTRGEPALTYTWSLTGTPPAAVSFSANGTNAAKNTTATFSKAGSYDFLVTIADANGFSTTSAVTVTVQPTQSISISPPSAQLNPGAIQQLTATVSDQFGAITPQPAITWSIQSGGGTINSSGLYTAPAAAGSAIIKAVSGALSTTANILIGDTDKLIAQYKFNQSSGAVAIDNSGRGNNANLAGAYGFTAGTNGNALTLTGGSATLPTGIVSTLTGDFTIATWVKLSSIDTWARIFDFGSGTGTYMFLSTSPGNSRPRFAITTSGGAGEQQINSSVAISTATWTHIAVSLSGNTATLYINGAVAGTNANMTLRPSSLGSTTANYLGDSQYINDPALQGSLDDFRIYGRAVPGADIAALASQPRFAYVFNNHLYIDADGQALTLNAAGGNVTVTSGSANRTFASSSFADILIAGTDGNDALTQLATMPGPITFVGGTGADTYQVASGVTAAFNADLGASLTLQVDGAAAFNTSQHLASLLVSGTVSIAPGGGRVVSAGTVQLVGSGKLDLADDAIVVRSGSAGTWNGSTYSGVSGLVASGRSGRQWDGAGIYSSLATTTSDFRTIAVATASDALGIASDAVGLWFGETVTGSAVLVLYTYGGDANLDGKLNIDDYVKIDTGIAGSRTGWSNGDFNYDGKVNIDDYVIIDTNIASQSPPTGGAASSQEPMPAFAAASAISVPPLVWSTASPPDSQSTSKDLLA